MSAQPSKFTFGKADPPSYDPERDLAIAEHDIPARGATGGYNYADCSVALLVGDRTYNISHSRLTLHSPVFRDMFGLPQPRPSLYAGPSYEDAGLSSEDAGPSSEDCALVCVEPAVEMTEYDKEVELSEGVPPPTPTDGRLPATVPAEAEPVHPPADSDPTLKVLISSAGINGHESTQLASPSGAVRLYHEPEDFEHYLWCIHADYLDFVAFAQTPASVAKCTRLLCIASIAHQYESTRLANRTLGDAFALLEQNPTLYIDAELAARVVLTPRRWVDAPDVVARSRKILIEAMRTASVDTLSVIFVAEPLDDHELLGWAYYYLLKDDAQAWRADPRLRDVDFRRLTAGAFALANEWYKVCRAVKFEGEIDPRIPSWAVFEKLQQVHERSYRGLQNRFTVYRSDVKRAEIERKLFTFFKDRP